MTDDPLIAEIEKMIDNIPYEAPSGEAGAEAKYRVQQVLKLVIADRQRQQEEKEKIIKFIKESQDCTCTDEEIATRKCYHWAEYPVSSWIAIIQGKEQKEEREASK